MSEDEAYDRAGVDQLPEKCYREVHKSCLQPDGDKLISCMFKEKCCKKAHHRTHESNRSNGNRKDHAERMATAEIYHAACAGKSKLGYNKEIKNKCNRSHKCQFMKSGKENLICHCTCV